MCACTLHFNVALLSDPANLECVLTVSFSRTLPELAAISTQLAPCRTVKIGGAGSKGIALLEGKAHVFIAPLSMRLSRWSVLPNRAEARTSGQLQEWRRVEKPAQRLMQDTRNLAVVLSFPLLHSRV